jgi:hypothetical protein
MHNRRTIRAALAAFKGNIYQKHIQYVREFSYPTTTKIYKFKKATKQKWAIKKSNIIANSKPNQKKNLALESGAFVGLVMKNTVPLNQFSNL